MTLQDEFAKAQVAFDAGDTRTAAVLCDAILLAWPDQSDTLHLRGLAALTDGETEQALRFLRLACAATGAHARYHSNLAELCRRAGLLLEGEQAARRAVTMQPDLLDAWSNLGILLQESGQFAESRTCLERVLVLDPGNASAHNNFANTCKRLNLIGLAERHWLKALDLRQDYPEPHSGLAFMFCDAGDYARAAFHAREAIALRPRFADAYLNLALVEAARDDPAAAIAVLDTLLAFAPAHAIAMAAKALALEQLDRLEEGLHWAERAAAAAPDNAEAVHAFGRLSQAADRIGAARVAYELAIRLPGTAAEKAAGSRAQLLMEIGEPAAATRAFAEALAAYPKSAALYYHRSDLKRFSAGDKDIAAMQALLEPGAVESAHDRMLLHFTLGNAFLQLGDGPKAFAHLDEGNRMKRAAIRYESAATLDWMAAIAKAFDAETLEKCAAMRAAADASPAPFTPVFVIGMPRSGTTLVEQILASHPAAVGAGELNFVAQGIAERGGLLASAARLTGPDLHDMAGAYMSAVARRLADGLAQGHRYIVDKMPANFLNAGLIHLINGFTINQDGCSDRLDYFQLDLGTHDCVIAEGTWSESFADGPTLREHFHNRAEFEALFPDEAPPEDLVLCAPRPQQGPALEAALNPIVARASRALKPGPLRGFVDGLEGAWKVCGWANDTAHPEMPVLLEVLLDDRIIGTVLACQYRGDLLKAGISQGRCSFVFKSPVRLKPEQLATLQVRRAADGAVLPLSNAGKEQAGPSQPAASIEAAPRPRLRLVA